MVTFYHTVRFKSVCQAYYLSIYLYLSIYESNHIRLSLSIQAYIPIYLSVVVTMYPHLSIYLSIHPHKSTYHSVCPSFPTHPSIYLSIYLSIHLTLTPMRLCMSIYPFIYISSCCLSMYHSTIYLCTHPLPIYLCIRPSIQTQTQQSISVCLIHASTPMYLFSFACLSIHIYRFLPHHPCIDDKHR